MDTSPFVERILPNGLRAVAIGRPGTSTVASKVFRRPAAATTATGTASATAWSTPSSGARRPEAAASCTEPSKTWAAGSRPRRSRTISP